MEEEFRKLAKELTARKNFLKSREKEILPEISRFEELIRVYSNCGPNNMLYEYHLRLEFLQEELRDILNELETIYDDERELRSEIGEW